MKTFLASLGGLVNVNLKALLLSADVRTCLPSMKSRRF